MGSCISNIFCSDDEYKPIAKTQYTKMNTYNNSLCKSKESIYIRSRKLRRKK